MFSLVKNALKKVLDSFAVTEKLPIIRIDRATRDGHQMVCDILDPETNEVLRHVTVGCPVTNLDRVRYITNYRKTGSTTRGHDDVEYERDRNTPLRPEDRAALAKALVGTCKVIDSQAISREDTSVAAAGSYASARPIGHTL